jgi:hydroxymethylbilane synthase
MTTLRIGTRRSALATTQSEHVATALRERLGVETELVEITTDGDRSQASGIPLSQVEAPNNSVGVFVSALRDALLAGEVDVAVHSLKDLPTAPADGITLAAIPPREDPRDVVVARDGLTLGELPQGSRVGTGSPRRVSQVQALGLGVDVVAVRGNVDTRIGKVRSGEYDAVVLARAGLARLGRLDEATEVLDPLQVLPAPGQGALAVECRADDTSTLEALAVLDDPATRAAVVAERATLATLEGGCSAPIGALAELAEGDDGPEIWLRAVALSTDGALAVRKSDSAPLATTPQPGRRLRPIWGNGWRQRCSMTAPTSSPGPLPPVSPTTHPHEPQRCTTHDASHDSQAGCPDLRPRRTGPVRGGRLRGHRPG